MTAALMRTTGLLILSNAFMTMAWYGHLKFKSAPMLLARMDLVVGGDSGPGHLACSLGTPTVMIFGAKDPARYAPWGGPLAPIYHPIGCNPCRNTWCEHVTCLDRITPAEVASQREMAVSPTRVRVRRRPMWPSPKPSSFK